MAVEVVQNINLPPRRKFALVIQGESRRKRPRFAPHVLALRPMGEYR